MLMSASEKDFLRKMIKVYLNALNKVDDDENVINGLVQSQFGPDWSIARIRDLRKRLQYGLAIGD